jgi:glutaredoxin-related protein
MTITITIPQLSTEEEEVLGIEVVNEEVVEGEVEEVVR